MNTILLLIIILGMAAQNVLKKAYDVRTNQKGVFVFNAATILAATLFFVVTNGAHFDFEVGVLPYAAGFAASYALNGICFVYAIGCGSLSLTSLVTSYSLMVPTLYGLIFLHEKAGIYFYIGLAMLAVSLMLINYSKYDTKISAKWLILSFLSFLGNGLCCTIQKAEQLAFNGGYKNEFMILALLIAFIATGLVACAKERGEFKLSIKKGALLALVCGAANGLVNLLVMILSAAMSVSVMFPLISAGGIVVTFLISFFIYRENLSKKQYAGLAVGILAILFLSI